MHSERLLIILKARQLGISWLAVAYALWLLLYRPPATVLLFSLRAREAMELLRRLKGMYRHLPRWMQARRVVQDNELILSLSNGSQAFAFSTRGGRSYTGTLALVDEADFVPDLSSFLNGVKPTIDAGGKLFLVSTVDKKRPVSPFKNLFRASVANIGTFANEERQTLRNNARSSDLSEGGVRTDYVPVFLPWHVRPDRDADWHARTKAEMFAQRGSDDDFYAEYPATPEEALAPEQLDRRIPWEWIKACVAESINSSEVDGTFTPIRSQATLGQSPSLPGLTVYSLPVAGRHYVIGADPAEGNPNSDESAATVVDAAKWEEVATLVGKVEPGAFAQYIEQLSSYYNQADVMVERNNHGHSVINALLSGGTVRVLAGYDGRSGWLSNIKGKPLMYDAVAEAIKEQTCTLHSPQTISQLASIEASTLRAPEGLHDDRADSFALAIAALVYGSVNAHPSRTVVASDPLDDIDRSGSW